MRTPKHDFHESTLVELCWQADVALYWIAPTYESDLRRNAIFEFVRDVLLQHHSLQDCHVMLTGSFSAKTYLPDADIDISIHIPVSDDIDSEDWVFFVNDALCRAAVKSGSHSPRIGATPESDDRAVVQKYPIRHVTFVNGRVKVVSCVVGNIYVDISVCAPSGSLAAAVMMEEVDRHLLVLDPPRYLRNVWSTSVQRHVFKKSVLLIKAWCLYESGPLSSAVGGLEDLPILCSKTGRLSSYAISVMVLALFNETSSERNNYQNTTILNNSPSFVSLNGVDAEVCGGGSISADLSHPFLVLLRFLRVYSCFDFGSFALSAEGPVPLSKSNTNQPVDSSAQEQKRPLVHILSKIKKRSVGGGLVSEFPVKAWNIIDPLDCNNNLTMGVSKGASKAIQMGIDMGRRRMDDIIHHLTLTASASASRQYTAWTPPSRTNLEFVTSFFPALTHTYGACFSQGGGQPREVIAVCYRLLQAEACTSNGAAVSVSSPALGTYKSEIGHRLWALVQQSWPALSNELVDKVTGMLLENSSELLLPVMEEQQRLVPLVAHALAALGCEGQDGFPGVVFMVPGNGYRSDLCDHPMQRSIAFTRRRRRQRGASGVPVIVEEGSTVGYDLYGTELDCDLEAMKRNLECARSPVKKSVDKIVDKTVLPLSDFDTFQLNPSSPSNNPPRTPNVIEASPVKVRIRTNSPVRKQTKNSSTPPIKSQTNRDISPVTTQTIASPVKSQKSCDVSPKLSGRKPQRGKGKVQTKSPQKPPPSVKPRESRRSQWHRLPASLLTSLALVLSASAFYIILGVVDSTSDGQTMKGPVYDILAKVVNINLTQWSHDRTYPPAAPSHTPPHTPSSNSCDDTCPLCVSEAVSAHDTNCLPCDALAVARTWVLQGRDTILGDLVQNENNLVYKWEKNNQTVGVVTP